MERSFDVIVIGGGLGGLVSGALAAQAGARVLVLERHDQVGGAATLFTRRGMRIDAGLHQIDGFDGKDPKQGLFQQLGLSNTLQLVALPEFYAVHQHAHPPFVMPALADQHRAQVAAAFPAVAPAIHQWFATLSTLRDGLSVLANAKRGGHGVFDAAHGVWSVMRHERHTVGGYLDTLFGSNEAVKIALGANLPYYGDDPDQLSLLFFAAAQGSFYRGNYYIRGGSGQLSAALAAIITNHNGAVYCGRVVQQIFLEHGRVAGVSCTHRDGTGGEVFQASTIFANAAPMVVAAMLPFQERRLFQAAYGPLESSPSLWCVYLGVEGRPQDYGLNHHSTFLLPPWMGSLRDYRQSAALLAQVPNRDLLPPYVVANYGVIDAGLENGDTTLVVLTGLDRLANWDTLEPRAYTSKKNAWCHALVHDFIRRFPGLGERIVVREMATARTMARYLNTPGGAVYGFAQTAQQAGRHRPGARSPVPGLWLASAYAMPGGGFSGAMLAGQQAFRAAFAGRGGV